MHDIIEYMISCMISYINLFYDMLHDIIQCHDIIYDIIHDIIHDIIFEKCISLTCYALQCIDAADIEQLVRDIPVQPSVEVPVRTGVDGALI